MRQLEEDLARVGSGSSGDGQSLRFLSQADVAALSVALSDLSDPPSVAALSTLFASADAGTRALVAALEARLAADSATVQASVQAVLKCLGEVEPEGEDARVAAVLQRVAGQWPQASFQSLVALVLSRAPGSVLMQFNPALPPSVCDQLMSVVTAALFRSIRMSQAKVCLSSARGLLQKLVDVREHVLLNCVHPSLLGAFAASPLAFLLHPSSSHLRDFFVRDVVASLVAKHGNDVSACHAGVQETLRQTLMFVSEASSLPFPSDSVSSILLALIALHMCGYDVAAAKAYIGEHDLAAIVALVGPPSSHYCVCACVTVRVCFVFLPPTCRPSAAVTTVGAPCAWLPCCCRLGSGHSEGQRRPPG